MAEEKLGFQAEVSKLLDIVAHSLYTHREIFLRELISNASDACDRLRYLTLTSPELVSDDAEFRIRLSIDAAARTVSVADNGIGMNRDELIENLGTIARSGTAGFLGQLSGDAKKDMALIGQFGVGFYSGFMVADRVEVTTRKAGEEQSWRWTSDGQGEFTVGEADEGRDRGTTVTLHMREDAGEFLEALRLRQIVKTYSDHIGLPIVLVDGDKEETVNAASALWTRPKGEITDDQYKEFYHHAGHAMDDPWLTLHYRAEGVIEYTGLLFVPSVKPFDLFDPTRRNRVKLYVRRVFITDDCPELLPTWLRFLRGVVDSEDLPRNISRETLQHNPMLAKMRSGLVKRVLGELKRKAGEAAEDYEGFWENFGAVVKEGLYESAEHRDALLDIVRFRSTAATEGTVSLADYLGRMKEGQEAIFYIVGDDLELIGRSPQLEGFAARGVEVLLLTDPVDEFWIPVVGAYQEKPFHSVTRGEIDLSKMAKETEGEAGDAEAEEPEVGNLVALLKLTLKDAVKDVRVSERLTDSPVCLVADADDLDMHLERLLKQHHQLDSESRRVLEINPRHALITELNAMVGAEGATDALEDVAHLLLDQARIFEGEPLPDPRAFSRRLASILKRGLSA